MSAVMITLFACSAVACQPVSQDEWTNSTTYEMSESSKAAISEITDFKSAEAYALANGYYDGQFCKTYLKGGEKVWFSASYDFGEAGQAYGNLEQDGSKLFFVQQGNPTNQMMVGPGVGGFTGKSLWEFNRYFKTVCSIAFGKGRSPDYDSIRAEMVSMTGGTAGGNVNYSDALKLSLHRSSNGGKTDVIMIFVKGLGPRVVEFRETNMPAGTSKVYIDGQASGSRI
jgi:hypothetical protein